MPILINTNPFLLKGYAYRQKYRGFDLPTTYHSITSVTGLSVFDKECSNLVTDVFKNGKKALKDYDNLLLMEYSYFIGRHQTAKFLHYLRDRERCSLEEVNQTLQFFAKDSFYTENELKELHERIDAGEVSYMERNIELDSLRGIIICMVVEGLQLREAFAELKRMFPEGEVTSQDSFEYGYNITSDGLYFQQRTPAHLNLTTVPWNVLTNIIGHLDIKSRLYLKDTCKFLRRRVDMEPAHLETVTISDHINLVGTNTWEHTLNADSKWLRLNRGGYVMEIHNRVIFKPTPKPFPIKKAAGKHLKWLFSLPNFTIGLLNFVENPELEERLDVEDLHVLSEIKNLKVEYLIMENPSTASSVMHIMKAVDLNYIGMIVFEGNMHFMMDGGFNLLSNKQQWAGVPSFVSLKNFTSFGAVLETFRCFDMLQITFDDIRLKEFFQLIMQVLNNCPELHSLLIDLTKNPEEIEQIRKFISKHTKNSKGLCVPYPEPNSDQNLMILAEKHHIRFCGPCYKEVGNPRDEDVPEEFRQDEYIGQQCIRKILNVPSVPLSVIQEAANS